MLSNDKGFSLVQVLISSGLLGAAAVVGIKMMANQEKLAKSTNQRYEMAYIHEEMWRTLQDMSSCEATFVGKTPTEVASSLAIKKIVKSYTSFNERKNIVLYETFQSSSKLYGVKNLKIANYSATQRVTSIEPILDFTVTFDKGENSIGGQFVTKVIPIVYSTEGGKIANCNALPMSSKESAMSETDLVSSNKVKLTGPIAINTLPSSELSLKLAGGLYFDIMSNRPKCELKNAGMITYDRTSESLFLCTGDPPWRSFGKDKLDWSRPTKVVKELSATDSRMLGEYKLCTLAGVKGAKNDDCILSNIKVDFINTFTWELDSSQNKSGSCAFLCFN